MDRERLATFGKGLLVAILLAQSLGLLLVLTGDRENPPDRGPPKQRSESGEKGADRSTGPEGEGDGAAAGRFSRRHVNSRGEYSVRYPGGWSLQARGSVTELTSPDGAAKVSFGRGSPGELQSSAQALLDAMEREFGDVVITETRVTRISGHPARLAEGRATNDSGIRLRFRAVSVTGRAENFAILGFEEAGGSNAMRATTTGIMRTFRPASEGSGTLSMSAAPAGAMA